jgi:hypothetical protein
VWRKGSNKLLGRERDLRKRAAMVIANTPGKPVIERSEDWVAIVGEFAHTCGSTGTGSAV